MYSRSIFHVFRNTPFGRDTLLQAIYFAKKVDLSMTLYTPRHNRFLMHFEKRDVAVDLDKEFLVDSETANEHADAILADQGVMTDFFVPSDFTTLELPDVPVDFRYMSCPRSISDLSTKIGMGYIGPKVRQIVQNAAFPVLIPTPVFKPWHRIVVFFGGSKNATNAVKVALQIHQKCGLPLHLFTMADGHPRRYYEDLLEENELLAPLKAASMDWMFFSEGRFKRLLFEVPSDALAVVGAYGHSAIKEILFGSKMEAIQTILPNNMLIIGPHCRL